MAKESTTQQKYDYFYGEELRFAFFRIPKLMISRIEFKHLSNDAKLLYGMLLDRSALSMKNGWVDQENSQTYIFYTIREVSEDLSISPNTAVKLMKELESTGLVSRIRHGQGNPDRIFVHDFTTVLQFETQRPQQTVPGQKYDYFYGEEPLQYAFFRIPKPLISEIEFKSLSNDAKLLYGLLLDRSMLSKKNGWIDRDTNRVYIIYTLESVMETLNIGHTKAVRLLKELEEIGLLTKLRQGQGKPTKLYVHNFMAALDKAEKNGEKPRKNSGSLESQNAEVLNRKNDISSIEKSGSLDSQDQEVRNTKKKTSKIADLRTQEFEKRDKNNNDTNNTLNNTNQSIYGGWSVEQYISIIRENIDYSESYYDDPISQEYFDEIFHLICEVVCVKRESIRIAGQEYPYSIIKSVFLKLTHEHVSYVMFYMQHNTKQIKNIKNYLISALYNSYYSKNYFWQNLVNHDMYDEQTT